MSTPIDFISLRNSDRQGTLKGLLHATFVEGQIWSASVDRLSDWAQPLPASSLHFKRGCCGPPLRLLKRQNLSLGFVCEAGLGVSERKGKE